MSSCYLSVLVLVELLLKRSSVVPSVVPILVVACKELMSGVDNTTACNADRPLPQMLLSSDLSAITLLQYQHPMT